MPPCFILTFGLAYRDLVWSVPLEDSVGKSGYFLGFEVRET